MPYQPIFRRRTREAPYNTQWSPWTGDLQRGTMKTSTYYDFKDGGQLIIYMNLLTTARQDLISQELLACNRFRQYRVQNNNEPRVHFLLHEEGAADDVSFNQPQPGYSYGNVAMKARSFDASLAQVQRLSVKMQRVCQCLTCPTTVDKNTKGDTGVFWNIGADCIVYRDGNDQINYHADNDQGEQLILTVLVSSPIGGTRKIRIRNKNLLEEFELFLDAGDAYSMDGNMQESYLHSVPRDLKCTGNDATDTKQQRIVIVFRRGNQVIKTNDSGTPVPHLFPRILQPYRFGRLEGLKEGSLYSRTELGNLNAHR